ncbi:MAG: response regulator transcription factor [Burkholderiaceae bacterium]
MDDHQLLREGIAGVVEDEPGMRMVAEASTGAEAIRLFRAVRPDITLMDLLLPDMSGIDAMIEIRKDFPKAQVIILTTYRGDAQSLRALQAGASGYLLKSMLRKDLVETIRLVHSGIRHVPAEVASDIAEHLLSQPLTDREIQVLRLVAIGNSNKRVAMHLGVSEDTVKAHMKNISSKLMANDRTHAVTIALKRGIIDM